MREKIKENWSLFLMASLTLGLAPFTPPHLWEKLTWIANGTPMKPIDWFDLVMHGTPWVLLILSGIFNLTDKKKPSA